MGVDGWVNVKKWVYGRIVALYDVACAAAWREWVLGYPGRFT